MFANVNAREKEVDLKNQIFTFDADSTDFKLKSDWFTNLEEAKKKRVAKFASASE
jgi:hypothetical protein